MKTYTLKDIDLIVRGVIGQNENIGSVYDKHQDKWITNWKSIYANKEKRACLQRWQLMKLSLKVNETLTNQEGDHSNA